MTLLRKRLVCLVLLTALFLTCGIVLGDALHLGGALADGNGARTDSGIRLDKQTYVISPLDKDAKLTVLGLGSGTAKEPVVWSVSPSSVADIDAATGIITPKVTSGRAVITATGTVTGATAKCALVVRAATVKTVKLNAKNLTIAPGKLFRFRAAVEPLAAPQGEIVWSYKSLNPPASGQASRFDEQSGELTAGSVEGEILLITAAAGGKTVTARVTVKAANVSSVKFKQSSYQVRVGKVYDLGKRLTVAPTRASDTSVTWKSSNEQVAVVDDAGLVTVLDEGTAKITATSNENPEKYASCTVRGTVTRVKSIAISASNAVGDPGDVFSVTAIVKPSTATFTDVTWTSGNEEVASVDANGTVTIRAPGKAIITASTDKGKKSAKLTVRARGGNMQTIKVSAAGDVVLGGDKKKNKYDSLDGSKVSSYTRFKMLYDQFGPDYFFRGVDDIFRGDDLTVINLECTLTNSSSREDKRYVLQGNPAYAQMLPAAGIEVANLANNHSLDLGGKGYNDTTKNLRGVNVTSYGFGTAGTSVANVNGVRVGFAGFISSSSRSDIARAIRKLKKDQRCAVVIVSFHWTYSPERTSNVTGAERSFARFAINRGADLVLGHHKHLVSGIERYKGKMIAYDLGNFVATLRNKVSKNKYLDKDTMIYQQRFNIFEDGYVECVTPNIIPCMYSDSEDTLTGNPRVLTGEDAERVLEKVRRRTLSKDKQLVRTVPNY